MAKAIGTKKTLLALGIAMLIVSFGFMVFFWGKLSISAKPTNLIHVACVGDSITEGSGYPAHLQAMLGDSYRVGNFGVSGSTVLLNSDTPYMMQPAFQKAKAFQPSIVVIMLGTNDAHEITYQSIENFQASYKKLIAAYQELESKPQIWLVTPPPIFENELSLSEVNLEQGVIPQIEQVAAELDLPLIDVNTVLMDYPEYFGDGVHPSSEGAMLIASEINQAITSNSVPDTGP
ncbi:MAG: GDSL-type esterase/lipase family protein [Candidatus Bathyarchaeota archaeon]|nr:GDSL-type esterase/lipase family protein [Candidatus Bathyarchaeota archaeon]